MAEKTTNEVLHMVQQAKRKYQMFAEAEGALQVLAGLEQNTAELTAIVAGLKKEQAEAQAAIDTAKATSASILKDADASATAMKRRAEYDAKALLKDASDKIAGQAAAQSQRTAEADAHVDEQAKVANELAEGITEARKTLEDVNNKIAEARKAVSGILAG